VPILEAHELQKFFTIPSQRRNTVRESLFGILTPVRTERLDVLKSVSFKVEQGETVGLIGRNGGGKSTLLKLLSGIYQPDGGRLSVRARITPILELGVGWSPELDAVDNILLIGTVMGLSLREARAGVAEILDFAGLDGFANLPLKHYSTGMAARLAYAVAFQAVRECLILDEVFSVGDAAFRARCEARFRQLHAQGHTIVLVSHDGRAVSEFCTRALWLQDGVIRMEGPAKAVLDAYQEAELGGPLVRAV
jgi:ABC-type polysaccharide/polyol phosphate transport system ATPase subunit